MHDCVTGRHWAGDSLSSRKLQVSKYQILLTVSYKVSVQESMRRNPTAGITTLRIQDGEDVTLSCGLRCPAGTALWTPFCCLQNSV